MIYINSMYSHNLSLNSVDMNFTLSFYFHIKHRQRQGVKTADTCLDESRKKSL